MITVWARSTPRWRGCRAAGRTGGSRCSSRRPRPGPPPGRRRGWRRRADGRLPSASVAPRTAFPSTMIASSSGVSRSVPGATTTPATTSRAAVSRAAVSRGGLGEEPGADHRIHRGGVGAGDHPPDGGLRRRSGASAVELREHLGGHVGGPAGDRVLYASVQAAVTPRIRDGLLASDRSIKVGLFGKKKPKRVKDPETRQMLTQVLAEAGFDPEEDRLSLDGARPVAARHPPLPAGLKRPHHHSYRYYNCRANGRNESITHTALRQSRVW